MRTEKKVNADDFTFLRKAQLVKSKINMNDKEELINTFRREALLQKKKQISIARLDVAIAHVAVYNVYVKVRTTFKSKQKSAFKSDSHFKTVNSGDNYEMVSGVVPAAYTDITQYKYDDYNMANYLTPLTAQKFSALQPITKDKDAIIKVMTKRALAKAKEFHKAQRNDVEVTIIDYEIDAFLVPVARFYSGTYEVGLLNLANHVISNVHKVGSQFQRRVTLGIISLIVLAQVGFVVKTLIDIAFNKEQPNYFSVTDGNLTAYTGKEKKVTIPADVVSIGAEVFRYKDIEEVIFNEGLEEIGARAFSYTKLTNLIFPSTLVNIHTDAFYAVPSLTTTIFNEGLKLIGNSAFAGTKLETIILPSGLKNIDEKAFANTDLTHVQLPDDLNYIGNEAFSNTKLTTFALRNMSATSLLGSEILSNTKTLTAIEVPGARSQINDRPFITSFFEMVAGDEDPDYHLVQSQGSMKFAIPKALESITVTDGHLPANAFANFSSISSFTLEEGVTSIGKKAFAHANLTSITIPNSVTMIDDEAFLNNQLTTIIIPDTVTYLGANIFNLNPDISLYFVADAPGEDWDENWANGVLPTNITFGHSVA